MSHDDSLPNSPPAEPIVEGTVRWYSAIKRIGEISLPDKTKIFIPPYGLAADQQFLIAGQPVTLIIRTNNKGIYACEVRAVGEATDYAAALALQIAKDLNEALPRVRLQIQRIIEHIGIEPAIKFVLEAHHIEKSGGMLIPDGSRRRTLGGVFFALVRKSLPPERQMELFPPLYLVRKRAAKAAKLKAALEAGLPPPEPQPPPPPPVTWPQRLDLIEGLLLMSGKATTVKVTVIGRPETIAEKPQFTLLTLIHRGPLPALPKGIPAPDQMQATKYSIYIGKKQWKLVAESIRKPEDMLIVEGVQMFDAPSGTIAVFATKVTTKLIQQAQRQPKKVEE